MICETAGCPVGWPVLIKPAKTIKNVKRLEENAILGYNRLKQNAIMGKLL